ncbi:MAG TPA: MmcQ/YjbR family DNA-binding protein [Acidimicrobiales bacterium]|nr:MmcQ/YjbR family DNA-binding protein [Acidimicrobiales bacterium]
MTPDQARRLALSLPEAHEAPHFEKSSFRVGKKIFATLTEDGRHLHVFIDEAETRAAVEEDPASCEELWWGKRLSGVRVALAAADPDRVVELLEEA